MSVIPEKMVVTGGAGFIGSTLVDRLMADGHTVLVVDNFETGRLSNLEHAEAEHGDRLTLLEHDIRSDDAKRAIAAWRPDVVFHLAAQIDVRKSVADPSYDASVNVVGGINVLEGARLGGARKFVFASSGGTIYGEPAPTLLPLDERAPQHPVSPYGMSKKAFGDYLERYSALHGLAYATLALANVYGPRQGSTGEAGVVSIFARTLIDGGSCTIYGDGSTTRDYVYVDDVADAFVRAAHGGTGLYNVGTGIETTAKDLHAIIAAHVAGHDAPMFEPARTGELDRSALNSARLESETGWRPHVGLVEGVLRVIDSLRREAVSQGR